MYMTSTVNSDFSTTTTTSLLDLVAAVSVFTDNDRETVQVVRHMLRSQRFWYSGQAQRLEST